MVITHFGGPAVNAENSETTNQVNQTHLGQPVGHLENVNRIPKRVIMHHLPGFVVVQYFTALCESDCAIV